MSEEIKPYSKKNKKNMSFEEIDLLKQRLIKVDANNIIVDALNSASKSLDKYRVKNQLLEQTKKQIVNTFLSNIYNKENNTELINKEFINGVKNFINSSQLLADRIKKQTKEYISKYEAIDKQNKILDQRYLDIKNQFKDITVQQGNCINQIEQMRKKDNVLSGNKNTFNDFLKHFIDQTPSKIIEDIEKQVEGQNIINKVYKNIRDRINLEKHLFEILDRKNNEKLSDTNSKILNLEEDKFLIQTDFENTVSHLKKEIRKLQGLKEDNDKFRKMLYQLYNRLIGAYCLDKNIRKNKKFLKLEQSDYKPNLLDDNEICKYIRLMISSMNPITTYQLLREAIAYSNMITRVYLQNKINVKYDPLSTFKELKDIMNKNEEKILQLSNDVKEYENKINSMAIENKKISNMINYFHQEKYKMIENKQNINSSLNARHSANLSIKKDRHYRKILVHSKKSNESSSLMSSTYNYFFEKNKKRKKSDFLMNNKNFKQRRHNIKMLIHKKKSNASSLKKADNTSNTSVMDIHKKNENFSIDQKNLKNPLFQSLHSMNAKKINKNSAKGSDGSSGPKQVERNKKLNKSKSQSMATYIKQFEQLINHTNRLFLYQAKIAPKFIKEKNFENLKNQKKKNDINSFIRNNSKNQIGNLLQEFVKTKIVSRINGMINNLEYKENDEEDESELIPIK